MTQRARKRFGQHFLEPAWVQKVLRAIDPKPEEAFLEIGPGRGALTLPLAARARAIVAFEIDRDLAAALEANAPPNVGIVEGDFLESSWTVAEQPEGRLRVVGNLPYNVASPILFKLAGWFAGGLPIGDATVMVQREVADRLTARVGTHEYGVLTILLGHVSSIDRLLSLPPGAFRPAPKVHSTLVRLRFHAPEPRARDEAVFSAVVRSAFTRRRKTIANALAAVDATIRPPDALAQAGIDPRRRPETMTIAEWVALSDVYAPARAVL